MPYTPKPQHPATKGKAVLYPWDIQTKPHLHTGDGGVEIHALCWQNIRQSRTQGSPWAIRWDTRRDIRRAPDSAGPVEHVQTTLSDWQPKPSFYQMVQSQQREEKNVIDTMQSCPMSVGNGCCHGAREEIFEYKYSNENGGKIWLSLQGI